LNRRSQHGSRALAALLLFLLLAAGACGPATGVADDGGGAGIDVATAERSDGQSPATGASAAPAATIPEAAPVSETKRTSATGAGSARSAREAVLTHRASPENITDNSTYLDEPEINGNPDAILLVTRNAGGGDDEHPMGVWYDRYRDGGRWAIFNQDLAPMVDGSSFDVAVFGTRSVAASRDGGGGEENPGAPLGETAFVHQTTPGNVAGDSTYIDDPLLNGVPNASVSVTQSWNPGGGDGVYNDHRVSVRYDEARDKWAVYNEDRSAMPEGVAFNVLVSEAGERETPAEGFPEYRDFYSQGDPETPEKLISSDSSAGTIPAVKPFNFGRDPGGPEDKTLYLTIPKLGIEDIPVFDTVSEEKLKDGTVHIPATGYPWQDGANVFIAGHRIGYANTESYYVFFRLDELAEGDEIQLEDSAGGRYVYRVTRQTVVGPNSVEVMNTKEGKSLVTLQTCTLPDYDERLIIQGELVEKDA
jgi:sortase A